MTDDFVKQAFADANDNIREEEFKAYKEVIMEDDGDTVYTLAALAVGMQKLDTMLGRVLQDGDGDVFAKYCSALVITAFHLGFRKGTEVRL